MTNAIEIKNITKYFNKGKLIANDNISLNIAKSTIHAIIGENGAGKTTLLSIIFGVLKQDKGEIFINGKKVNFNKASDARNHKLGMVYQHFQLIESFSILENIIIGNEESKMGFTIKKNSSRRINDLSKKYKFNLKANTKVKNLTVGQKQKVEILKLLYSDSNILIFDEPTAMLSPIEIDELFKVIKLLKKQGKTIIFISHKLHEVKKIAEYGTVIRRGKVVKNFIVKDSSINQMASWMVGKKTKTQSKKKINYSFEKNDVVFSINNLKTRSINGKLLDNISFDIKSGEIFGIGGVEGNGQVSLVENITGINKTMTSGSIKLNNIEISNMSVSERYKIGLSHIPEDRLKHGMIKQISAYENILLRSFGKKPFTNKGFIVKRQMKKYANDLIEKYDVRGTNFGQALGVSLSGGNQQKLVVGREVEEDAKLLTVFQPTRGVDIGASNMIHTKLQEEAAKGKAILLISYDLDELIKISDKIGIMSAGKIAGILKNNKKISKDKIGVLMAGGE